MNLPTLRHPALLILALLAPPLAGADSQPPPPPQAVLATVGATPISAEALATAASRRGRPVETPEQRRALLDDLVRTRLLVEAARAEGYERDPAVVAALEAVLASRFRDDRLTPRFSQATVSEDEVAAYYQAHPAEFSVPPRDRVAVIQITVPARASDEARAAARQRAEAARAEALALGPGTLSFGSVAVTYSDDPASRYRGGETEALRAGSAAAEALAALGEVGAVSPVVESPEGFFLVKLMDRRPGALRPLAEVAGEVRHRLLLEKKAAVEQAFYDALRGQFPVVVDEAALSAVPLAPLGKADRPPGLPR